MHGQIENHSVYLQALTALKTFETVFSLESQVWLILLIVYPWAEQYYIFPVHLCQTLWIHPSERLPMES